MPDIITRRADGTFEVRLPVVGRKELARLAGDLRDLIVTESQSSDPAVARLFPPAYPDDVLRELDFDRMVGEDLRAGRLGAIETFVATAGNERLTEEEVLSWLQVLNDLRLVLGTRLGVTEELSGSGVPDDDPRADGLELFNTLGWLVEEIVQALST